MKTRRLNRKTSRRLSRLCTRRLPGARRPRAPNDLSILCRIFEELIKSGERLRRYWAEMDRENERYQFDLKLEAALDRVYGPSEPPRMIPLPGSLPLTREQQRQLVKDEKALLKARLLLFRVHTQTAKYRRCRCEPPSPLIASAPVEYLMQKANKCLQPHARP